LELGDAAFVRGPLLIELVATLLRRIAALHGLLGQPLLALLLGTEPLHALLPDAPLVFPQTLHETREVVEIDAGRRGGLLLSLGLLALRADLPYDEQRR